MNEIKCSNCGFLNNQGMNFCTSCGNSVSSPVQSNIPTIEKTASEFPTFDQGNSLGKKNKSAGVWIVGVSIFVVLIGLGVIGVGLIFVISSASKDAGKNVNKIVNSNTETNKLISNGDASAELFDILRDRKEAGKFKQLTRTLVDVKEYFPYAKAAAQASYHNGSRYVSLAIGKFENFEDAKKNFDEQFEKIKKKGGRTQILAVSADGTINGVYQVKDTYTAEYCTKSAFCYRMASTDAKSLKAFIENFVL